MKKKSPVINRRPSGKAMIPQVVGALIVAACIPCSFATAYPEFQAWSQKNSGRFVNCAMCHAHPDGPDGVKPGQIGSLSPSELAALNQARSAYDPGKKVHSPILNEFGNSIVEQLGRREVIALRPTPEALAAKLDPASDVDGDGLGDAREFREGTDPLSAQSGNPAALFRINFVRQRFHILMIFLATACGLFGLNHLLRGLHRVSLRQRRPSPE